MKDKVAYNMRQAIKQVWDSEITQEYCKSLECSILCCIQAVTDNKGGPTKY